MESEEFYVDVGGDFKVGWDLFYCTNCKYPLVCFEKRGFVLLAWSRFEPENKINKTSSRALKRIETETGNFTYEVNLL